MIALGILALILGSVLGVHWLWVIGVISLVFGAALWILGKIGRPVAGRRNWY